MKFFNFFKKFFKNNIYVTVQKDDSPSDSVPVKLNSKKKLSKVREKLTQNSIVKMDDTLSFAKINNNDESSLAVIAREDEKKMILKEIINKESKILYLKSEFGWRFFKNKFKLENGCNVTLERANKRAFTIKDCKMDEIIDGYKNDKIQIDSEKANITTNDLFLIADADIPSFARLGVSVENSTIKNSSIKTNLTYSVIEYNKMSLKFKLEPTPEFNEAVKNVIDSEDPRKFKDVINEFGQFIPKEINLGGRAYFIARKNFEEDTSECSTNIGVQIPNVRIKRQTSTLLNRNKSFKYQKFKLIGGKPFSPKNFNESDWAESLKDFKYWSCINFKDPVNIFQLLSENLRRQVLLLIGKKILYTNTEDYTYRLSESGIRHTFRFNTPENILKILQDRDADCNIFATVIDKDKKDIFNCQVVWPPNENPKLIIHCIQKKFKKRDYKLKIRWMIIGYDINFDFDFNRSDFDVKVLKNDININTPNCQTIKEPLDLEYNPSVLCFGIPVLSSSNNSSVIGHHFFKDRKNSKVGLYLFSYSERNHVNLPNFTFYTFIISNHSNFNEIRKLSNYTGSDSTPNFISLYLKENECRPIFLRQKTKKIKIYTSVRQNQDNRICKIEKLKGLDDNLRYALF